MIPLAEIATTFSSLSHPSRVDILLCLLPKATSGLTAGEVAQATQIPPSTLAHHLREMEEGRVIIRRQEGRKTIITPCLTTLSSIAAMLTQMCCTQENPERPAS